MPGYCSKCLLFVNIIQCGGISRLIIQNGGVFILNHSSLRDVFKFYHVPLCS